MQVKIKKLHPDAVIPEYAKSGDAGLDLTAISASVDEHGNAVYGTGLAIEMPEGYAGFLFPRSSISKYDLTLANSVGVIDAGYRGEIIVKMKHAVKVKASSIKSTFVASCMADYSYAYRAGDRVAQLIIMPVPKIELVGADDLSDSERGDVGFGSSGK